MTNWSTRGTETRHTTPQSSSYYSGNKKEPTNNNSKQSEVIGHIAESTQSKLKQSLFQYRTRSPYQMRVEEKQLRVVLALLPQHTQQLLIPRLALPGLRLIR